ncbi:DUF6461 domain-containing protein [Lentzea sp. NPDC004782]|uniref:DUF6461 domain-containing protein n=1 Tax=Lentzea sp. NPDC004782 TaxID=3154458 RepID=UPI0033B82599
MRLPVPVVRADAVEHYAELLSSEALPSEALCLTAVRGLTIDEALARFDASPQTRTTTLADAGQASVNAFPDELFLVVAGERDGWVFLAEHNGFHGSLPEVLARLSSGTVAATVYWNVNFNNTIALARDGQILGEMDFVGGDEPTADLATYLEDLDFDDADFMCAAAIAFVERVTGVRLDANWATAPHQTAVITQPARFEDPDPAGWLVVNAREVFDLFRSAETSVLREIATMAASRACAAAGIDDPDIARDLSTDVDGLSAAALLQRREQLTDRLRESHFRALNLRWDRCTPPDPQADRVTRLQADVARRHADTTAEQMLVARAHALAAVRACLSKDAITSAAQALINACQADRAHWSDLREQAATLLSEAR